MKTIMIALTLLMSLAVTAAPIHGNSCLDIENRGSPSTSDVFKKAAIFNIDKKLSSGFISNWEQFPIYLYVNHPTIQEEADHASILYDAVLDVVRDYGRSRHGPSIATFNKRNLLNTIHNARRNAESPLFYLKFPLAS